MSALVDHARSKFPPPRLARGTRTVCIGAVAWGGDGKTPLARHLARRIADVGLPVSVVTRGYGGRSWRPRIVPGGALLDRRHDVHLHGDEAVMLSGTLRDVAVWAGDLGSAMQRASEAPSRILVVDDGLGVGGISWDLSISLLSSERRIHECLPAGPLRRPMGHTARAHIVGIRAPDSGDLSSGFDDRVLELLDESGAADHPWFAFCLEPDERADRLPVHLASGIARTARFERSARRAGYQVMGTTRFADHHQPSMRELADLGRAARENGACAVLVTEKDAPRFPRAVDSLPVRVLASHVELVRNPHVLEDALAALTRQEDGTA